MNWKPTLDTTALIGAMNSRSYLLLFDMASDALIESGSSMSLWDYFFLISCPVPRSRNFKRLGHVYPDGQGEESGYYNDFYYHFGNGLWYDCLMDYAGDGFMHGYDCRQ